MPSFINSAIAALFIGASAVSATYYEAPVVTGTGYSPAPTYAAPGPYSNGTGHYSHHPEYFTTTVCETKTYTDTYGSTTCETIPVYTTVCPYTTIVVDDHTTVVPATTYYPPYTTVVPGVVAATTGALVYPTYAVGAASSLQVSGLAAVVVAAVALAL